MHCGKKVALRVCHGGGAAQVDSDTFHFWGKKLSGMRTGAMLSKKVARNAYRGNVIKKRFFSGMLSLRSQNLIMFGSAKIYFDTRE